MTQTKENTLHLIIKQVYFDAILSGTMKQESREIKETTYKKFLETKKEHGKEDTLVFDETKISKEDAQKYANNPMVYNNGIYPCIPIPYQFLDIAVGYKKDRETLIVTVEEIHFEPMESKHGMEARFSDDGERMRIDKNGDLCIWQIVYTLGDILDRDLKEERN